MAVAEADLEASELGEHSCHNHEPARLQMPGLPGGHTGIALCEELGTVHGLPATPVNEGENPLSEPAPFDETPLDIDEPQRRKNLSARAHRNGR